MVIIDSIAFPFRQNVYDVAARSRLLCTLAQTLNQVAFEFNVAIVVTNHVTTRFDRLPSQQYQQQQHAAYLNQPVSSTSVYTDYNPQNNLSTSSSLYVSNGASNASTSIVPALGEQWSHSICHRIMLHWGNSQIDCNTIKHSQLLLHNENQLGGEDDELSFARVATGLFVCLLRSITDTHY